MFYVSILFFLFFNYNCLSITYDYDALHHYITGKYLFHEKIPMQAYIESKPYENFIADCSLNPMLKQLVKDCYSDDQTRKEQAQQCIEELAETFKNRSQELSVLHTTRSQLQRSDIAILGEFYGMLIITMCFGAFGIHYDTPAHKFKSNVAFVGACGSFTFTVGRLFYLLGYNEKHKCTAIHLLNLDDCKLITMKFERFFRSLLIQPPMQEQQETTLPSLIEQEIVTTDHNKESASSDEKMEIPA